MSSTVTWRATCSAPDEVWIPRRLQQLKSEVGEDGRLQELHQSVYLDQHFHSHGQVGVSSDDITSMAVGACQEAEAEHGACTVAPAAVQAVEEVSSSFSGCGFCQQAAQSLDLWSKSEAQVESWVACTVMCLVLRLSASSQLAL